ncbi:A24 family peptidase [uncultured Neptuniibacter sp.]|uniref:prepilin peptidase n=1 Tax=uncultured Neptuniibacter sp. TaxID=502143 RepID=UPI00260B4D52|nr:A24 family peptidase [uncultured Neptuniibacter sp.]
MSYFESIEWALAYSFLIALCVGSFLNVVIHRLPIMMEKEWEAMCNNQESTQSEKFNLSYPASTCPKCNHRIRWYENIPLFSYIFLRGRCSACKVHIPLRYPFVELLSALSVTFSIYVFGFNEIGLAVALLTWGLICLIFIDIDHQLLPDSITLPLLWLGILVNNFNFFTTLESAIYGAMAGYLSLWSVYWIFKLITGKEGMGYGDFKLLAALGAWVGLSQIPLIILLSSLVGAIFGIAMILLRNHQHQTPIPFGPYLAIAGWIALIWGENITHTYLQFIGL